MAKTKSPITGLEAHKVLILLDLAETFGVRKMIQTAHALCKIGVLAVNCIAEGGQVLFIEKEGDTEGKYLDLEEIYRG
jgi:hypothetical protein